MKLRSFCLLAGMSWVCLVSEKGSFHLTLLSVLQWDLLEKGYLMCILLYHILKVEIRLIV